VIIVALLVLPLSLVRHHRVELAINDKQILYLMSACFPLLSPNCKPANIATILSCNHTFVFVVLAINDKNTLPVKRSNILFHLSISTSCLPNEKLS
jgi:hypothetical protein